MRPPTLACISLLLATSSQQAWATCYPNEDYSVTAEFHRSDIVALVRAEGVVWLDENRKPTELRPPLTFGTMPGGFDPYIGAYYSVRLIKGFKGNPPNHFRIFSENTTARTPLRIGPILLLFIYRTRVADDYKNIGDLVVDNCGNSALASKVPKELSLISRLATHR
jgi:hypothetical protein